MAAITPQCPPICRSDPARTAGDLLLDLAKVLDVETVRPLIAALPEGTKLSSPFDSSRTSPKLKSPNVSAARRCTFRAYFAKALDTLRSHVGEPELTVTG